MKKFSLLSLSCVCLTALSCNGGTDSADINEEDICGDVDGPGGDTGDVPNVLGAWTVTFGQNEYDDGYCDVEGLEQSDWSWINGYMEIGGRIPDSLVATFDGVEEDQFWGLENHLGGIVFTGLKEKAGHVLYVSVGGHLYEQPAVDRDEIRGFGYVGVDIDGADAVIDCWIQGDFKATKSGN
jgi:hypothetical protein